jgi:HK97 family phage prohead protease
MADKVDNYYKVRNPGFEGACEKLDTFTFTEDTTVKVQYSPDRKKVKNYLFDNEAWTTMEAEKFVKSLYLEGTERKTTADIQKSEDGGYIAIASSAVEDRDGEVIEVEGWRTEHYEQNPQLLWMHNRNVAHNGLPIGKVKRIWKEKVDGDMKLMFEPEFDESTEFNRTVKKFVDEGLLNTFSVGFLPFTKEDNVYKEQELLEISLVPVPSNHESTFVQRAKSVGFKKSKAKQFVDIRSVVPYRAYDPAPESQNWDANVAIQHVKKWTGGPDKDDIDWNQYKEAFAWYDAENSEEFGAYKLPHHDVTAGNLVTVWRGVAAAMAALLGARGGVDVPDNDRRDIYDHLVKHYEQFDKTPPDFKFVESQELKELFDLEAELVSNKNFREFKKNLRDIKHFVNQTKREKREERKRVQTKQNELKKELMKSIQKSINEKLKIKKEN